MKILLACALAIGLLAPIKAQAATEYVLVFTLTHSPYTRTVVGGPFTTYDECSAILRQEGFTTEGMYSCQVINV